MKQESLNVLKGKTVILFISNLDISVEEIKEIEHQVGKPGRQYEIVWLPIFDKEVTPKEREEIGKKASLMKWYSLHFSLTLQPYVVKYIKQDWQFEKKPMMVVFDARGKVVNSNAYHMLMIWGSAAYPFNTPREETLWKETDLGLDFLIGDKEPVSLNVLNIKTVKSHIVSCIRTNCLYKSKILGLSVGCRGRLFYGSLVLTLFLVISNR